MISSSTIEYLDYWYWRIQSSGTSNQRRAWAEIRLANMSLEETVAQLVQLCRYYERLEEAGVTIA